MTKDAEQKVRDWWVNELLAKTRERDITKMNNEQAYNCRNMLAGFLQSCEMFGHITTEEAGILFKELAK